MKDSRNRIVLLTGGARSGKSRRALELARGCAPLIFVATATPSDEEMRARIARHRAERDSQWTTIEEPLLLASILRGHPNGAIVVDCLTLWLANALEAAIDIDSALGETIAAARARIGPTIFVTNEVGSGIVPAYPLGRVFRDVAGFAAQRIAEAADEVILMVAGLSVTLKSR